MIRVYYFHTPNVFKVLIALEEMGLEFEERRVDILKGEQVQPWFLAVSPNNKVPAIEDLHPEDGGPPITIFESGAILLYLSDKTGKLMPRSARRKAEVTQWLIWQAANQGPHMGQLVHYTTVASESVPYATQRHAREVERLLGVLNTRLADREYLAGEYSIADIMNYPWLRVAEVTGIKFQHFPHLARWFGLMSGRPAVKAALSETRIGGLEKAVEDSRPRKMK